MPYARKYSKCTDYGTIDFIKKSYIVKEKPIMKKGKYIKCRYNYPPVALSGSESLRILVVYLDFLVTKKIDVQNKEVEVVKTLVSNTLSNNLKIIVPDKCRPLLYRILSNTLENAGLVVEFAETYNHNLHDYFERLKNREQKRRNGSIDHLSIQRVRLPSESVYYSGKAM